MICFWVRPLQRERQAMKDKCKTLQIPVLLVSVLSLPEAERGSPGEEDRLGFGLRLLEEPEEGVILHADLPEDLTAIPAGHGELQRVVVGVLLVEEETNLSIDAGRRTDCAKGREVLCMDLQWGLLSA